MFIEEKKGKSVWFYGSMPTGFECTKRGLPLSRAGSTAAVLLALVALSTPLEAQELAKTMPSYGIEATMGRSPGKWSHRLTDDGEPRVLLDEGDVGLGLQAHAQFLHWGPLAALVRVGWTRFERKPAGDEYAREREPTELLDLRLGLAFNQLRSRDQNGLSIDLNLGVIHVQAPGPDSFQSQRQHDTALAGVNMAFIFGVFRPGVQAVVLSPFEDASWLLQGTVGVQAWD